MEDFRQPKVIKAGAPKQPGTSHVYNFDDFHKRCDDHLEKTRKQIREMVIAAQGEIEAKKAQALKDAEKQGRQEGLRKATEEIQKQARQLAAQDVGNRLQTVLPALQQLAHELQNERNQWIADWENSVLTLALQIAGKVIHRHLEHDPENSLTIMRSVLELVLGKPHVQVRMSPRDVESLGPQAEALIKDVLGSATAAELVADPGISPGGCIVRTRQGEIDARVETQLERIAEELFQNSREG